jgi:hypothetical protein
LARRPASRAETFSAAAITQRLGKALKAIADDDIVGR